MSMKKMMGVVSTIAIVAGAFACTTETVEETPGTDGGADRIAPTADARPDVEQNTCVPPAQVNYTYTPPGNAQTGRNVCTPAQIDGLLTACLANNSTPAGCTEWRNANAACGTCALSASDAQPTGAFFVDAQGTLTGVNMEGCLSGFAPGCGPRYVEYVTCLRGACNEQQGGNCEGAEEADVDACQDEATGGQNATGPCGPQLRAAAQNCQPIFGQGTTENTPGRRCFLSPSEDQGTWLRRFALIHCGPPQTTTDGGTDAGTDAATDAGTDGAAEGG
jgi:hypothetical protein